MLPLMSNTREKPGDSTSASPPGRSGSLDLFMDWYDPAAHPCVWMRSETEFLVQ